MNDIITLEAENNGERLDAFISERVNRLSRSSVQRLIKEGLVLVEGRVFPKSRILKRGEQVTVNMPQPETAAIAPENLPLDIIYEDENLVVVNKARGMVVHPGPGHNKGTLVNALLYHCGDLSGVGGVVRPGIVHRLDRDTSGVMLVAKNDAAHQELSRQFKERLVKKVYLALVLGRLEAKEIRIDIPVARDPCCRQKMAAVHNGREAVTEVKLLARAGENSLVAARPQTGRTHQIRVHLSYIGNPVWGDMLYGGWRKDFKQTGWEGQALHARRIGFIHPVTGSEMSFTASFPPGFKELLRWRIEKRIEK